MAKKAKPSIPAPNRLPMLGMPAINPFAPGPFGFQAPSALESRKVVKANQRPSEFILDDGTKLTITPILIDVKRATNQWGANGKPMYIMTLTNLNDTDSPKRLMDPRLQVAVDPRKKIKKAKKVAKKAKR